MIIHECGYAHSLRTALSVVMDIRNANIAILSQSIFKKNSSIAYILEDITELCYRNTHQEMVYIRYSRKQIDVLQNRGNKLFIDLFRENFIRQSFLHHYNISSMLVKLFDYFPLYIRTFVFDVEMVMDPISRSGKWTESR